MKDKNKGETSRPLTLVSGDVTPKALEHFFRSWDKKVKNYLSKFENTISTLFRTAGDGDVIVMFTNNRPYYWDSWRHSQTLIQITESLSRGASIVYASLDESFRSGLYENLSTSNFVNRSYVDKVSYDIFLGRLRYILKKKGINPKCIHQIGWMTHANPVLSMPGIDFVLAMSLCSRNNISAKRSMWSMRSVSFGSSEQYAVLLSDSLTEILGTTFERCLFRISSEEKLAWFQKSLHVLYAI